jgi:phosphopantetheinyl transferase (holo-ACP synthase)
MTVPTLVGNDVVDLGDPAIAQSHLRARFVERVCCASERVALARASDPKRLLWSLFAAKEAAYKIAAKMGPTVFAHREFVVAGDLTRVSYRDLVLRLRVDRHGDRIHAVASTTAAPILFAAMSTRAGGEDPGPAARRLLCAALAAKLGCEAAELAVIRERRVGAWDGFGPPHVVHRGAPIAADVSLAHDGRHVGFAAAAA